MWELGDGGELLTVAGASVAAGLITRAVRTVVEGLSTLWTRRITLFSAVTILVGGHLTTADQITFLSTLSAVFAGIVAGLGTAAAVDTVKHGFDYQTADRVPLRHLDDS